ncbi:TrbM/KikA/MpfK family conjugal transfer protein [Pandoraea apista]|uniref:TrbM/KikA/MpfK family conjugal transfer protein n=1 Tax=Pandoraea apista TaxID=93218 RepID=UPI0006582E20|nr:TrbM/KikA/MpfK family conjugal transfer protein [Pandoraea apista]ALS68413.1 hypothetical protein AT395_25050 [Pandoraea apista]CFB60437.1 TrbM [Pandoraea apista]
MIKAIKRILVTLACAFAIGQSPQASAQVLTGDVGLACEAILCLSSGFRPGECAPSLARYFGISFKFWTDTLRGRINFLNLCPAGNVPGGADMPSLINTIANGAGRCDADYLNMNNIVEVEVRECDGYGGGDTGPSCYTYTKRVISNVLPTYCVAYTQSQYQYLLGVKYVGEPLKDGHWISDASGALVNGASK